MVGRIWPCRSGWRLALVATTVTALCAAAAVYRVVTDGDPASEGAGRVARPEPPAGSTPDTQPPATRSSTQPSAPGQPDAPGWPDASTTGVPAGVALRPSGPISVTTAGTVLDGLEVQGAIDVAADDVVVRNSRIIGRGEWGVILRPDADNLLIEDSEIRGDGTHQLGKGVFNIGGMLTVRRTDISVVTDGIMTDHGLIEDNYLHDPRYFDGDHVDMIQSGTGPSPGMSLVIRHNTIVNPYGQTSAVALFQDFGVAHDVLVERNLLAGGGYALYAGAGRFGHSYRIQIVDNAFSRQVFPDGGQHGPVAYWDPAGTGNVWRGNVWLDTGEPVVP